MIVALIIFILIIVIIFAICMVGGNGDTEGEDGTQGGGILHHPSGKENEDKEVDDSRHIVPHHDTSTTSIQNGNPR